MSMSTSKSTSKTTSSMTAGGGTNSALATSSQTATSYPDPSNPSTAYASYYPNAAYNAQLQQYYQQYYANSYAQQLTPGYDQQQYTAYYQAVVNSGDSTTPYSSALAANTQYLAGYAATSTAANSNANEDENEGEDDDEEDDDPTVVKPNKKASNTLPYHCNEKMGLNPLIFTNIQQSPYFKNNLFQLKTYHEVIDEIYYNVKHLEPWEKGSRKVSGQTGMCGSVRGVGAGGIISTPFCLLYKLFTLRLTRKQVNGLIRHKDSAFIRGLGFMYIRYTQPPQDLWKWFEPYLNDEGQVDPKAGGGAMMTIGQMVRQLLTKLDWFSTLFPRIPIPIQKEIEEKLRKHDIESGKQHKPSRDRKSRETEDEPEEESKSDRSHRHHRTEARGGVGESHSRRSRSRSRSPTYDRYKYDNRHKQRKHDDYRHHSRRY